MIKQIRGGARIGAGRPVINPDLKQKSFTIVIDDARKAKFKALGGSKWLRLMIDNAT